MAEQYAKEGHRVCISARRTVLLKQIQQQFPQLVEYETFDVTGTENVFKLETMVEKLGGMDILVYSAGYGNPSRGLDWAIDQKTINTNIYGFTEIVNWAFNYFVKQGYGQIADISSVAATRGGSHAPAYNASKSFQSNYLEGIAIKAKKLKKDISVTCIEPGFVDTKFSKAEKLFWLIPVEKAARQMIRAIEKRRRRVYISRRWWLIAKVMKWSPFWLYRKFG
jgi:short-subunit dehydrogenase